MVRARELRKLWVRFFLWELIMTKMDLLLCVQEVKHMNMSKEWENFVPCSQFVVSKLCKISFINTFYAFPFQSNYIYTSTAKKMWPKVQVVLDTPGYRAVQELKTHLSEVNSVISAQFCSCN